MVDLRVMSSMFLLVSTTYHISGAVLVFVFAGFMNARGGNFKESVVLYWYPNIFPCTVLANNALPYRLSNKTVQWHHQIERKMT